MVNRHMRLTLCHRNQRPGLRERFVFHQHKYCTNKFWTLFCSSFRILWPYEFRDCYTFNTLTGEYRVSPMFDERISDLRSWTMSAAMFEAWPELVSDIPHYNPICSAPSARSVGLTNHQGPGPNFGSSRPSMSRDNDSRRVAGGDLGKESCRHEKPQTCSNCALDIMGDIVDLDANFEEFGGALFLPRP